MTYEKLVKMLSEGDKEYEPEAKVVVALLTMGCLDKKAIEKKSNVNNKRFENIWQNLGKGGYFAVNGKIIIDKDSNDTDIPFILMMLVAKGHLERK